MRSYGSDYRYQEKFIKKSNSPQKRSKRFKLNGPVLLVILILIILSGYLLIPESYSIAARESTVARKVNLLGLIIRDEKILLATITGKLERLAEEGSRIAQGVDVALIKSGPNEERLSSFWPGIISYKFDGLEEDFNLSRMKEIVADGFRFYRGQVKSVKEGGRIRAGEPVCKIIENLFVYLLLDVPKENLSKNIVPGKKVELILEDGSKLFAVPEKVIETERNTSFLVFKLFNFPPSFIQKRFVDLSLVIERFRGFLIPRKALFFEQGQAGVLINNQQDEPVFRPVSIIGEVGDSLVIEGLKEGDRVLVKRR